MTRDATTAFARTLADEWRRAGLRHAVLAPGSRSAPLALALADTPGIELHVFLDERSAGFFALGLGRATRQPAVLLCTSGTAAANFHPAVLEADLGRVPLLVCTADRPPELRDVGASQTVDQVRLYGGAVRWFVDAEVPADRPDAAAVWRSLAARALAETLGSPPGPVHVNMPTREPLVPTGAPLTEVPGRAHDEPWTRVEVAPRRLGTEALDRLAARVAASSRGLLVAGSDAGATPETVARFAVASGWPVLADVLSGLRTGAHAPAGYDLVARDPEVAAALRPELVLRVGAPLTSAAVRRLCDDVPCVLVDPDPARRDPDREAHELVVADAEAFFDELAARVHGRGVAEWRERWRCADTAARGAADAVLDGWDRPFEGRVARDVAAAVPEDGALVVGSSMPVRDLDTFGAPPAGVAVHANRGANGIDGFVSTALGVAAGSGRPVIALTGDLGLLHDCGGLVGASRRGVHAVLVVVDNDGGGIFSFLPQAELPEEHFETLFGTPHGVDLAALAGAHDVPVTPIETSDALAPGLRGALEAGGVRVLHVRTDRADNVARHREVWDAAARAARAALSLPER